MDNSGDYSAAFEATDRQRPQRPEYLRHSKKRRLKRRAPAWRRALVGLGIGIAGALTVTAAGGGAALYAWSEDDLTRLRAEFRWDAPVHCQMLAAGDDLVARPSWLISRLAGTPVQTRQSTQQQVMEETLHQLSAVPAVKTMISLGASTGFAACTDPETDKGGYMSPWKKTVAVSADYADAGNYGAMQRVMVEELVHAWQRHISAGWMANGALRAAGYADQSALL